MDDPGWSWPAWKFGMKRGDLLTSLHDQYNTFTYTIQDAEAFHHDVNEISRDAETTDEFHRLMAARRIQRLDELTDSLESLAVEIIANPKLMASDQWQHALQLFRSKSFDSIVRFFASYIPDDYPDRHDYRSNSSASSFSEAHSVCTASTKASSVDDTACSHCSDSDFLPMSTVMSEEPFDIDDDVDSHPAVGAPLSPPESEMTQSDDSASSVGLSEDYSSTNPPSRSMSFSGSESGFKPNLTRKPLDTDDDLSQADDCDTAATSVADSIEMSKSSLYLSVEDTSTTEEKEEVEEDEDEFPTTQYPEDDFDTLDTFNDTPDYDTPTPRQEVIATSYVDYKSMLAQRLPSPHRSPSPKPHYTQPHALHHNPRRSPEEALSRVLKPCDSARRRPRRDMRKCRIA